MPRPKDTIRKAFLMREDLEPRLLAHCEKMGFTQTQVFNLAVRQYLDGEDMKKFMQNADPEKLMKYLVDEAMKRDPDFEKKVSDAVAENESKKAP